MGHGRPAAGGDERAQRGAPEGFGGEGRVHAAMIVPGRARSHRASTRRDRGKALPPRRARDRSVASFAATGSKAAGASSREGAAHRHGHLRARATRSTAPRSPAARDRAAPRHCGRARARRRGPAPAVAAPPDLGPNVVVFDPSMPVAEIQATVDAINARQVDDEMGTDRYALLFKPGVYGTDDAAAADEGRLLHRGRRSRRLAGGRRHQRQDRGLQPVPGERRHEQLPRAGQLLAHAVQPDAAHQRRRARTAAAPRPTSGRSRRRCRCAGSTSPAGTCR